MDNEVRASVRNLSARDAHDRRAKVRKPFAATWGLTQTGQGSENGCN